MASIHFAIQSVNEKYQWEYIYSKILWIKLLSNGSVSLANTSLRQAAMYGICLVLRQGWNTVATTEFEIVINSVGKSTC